MAWFKKRWAKLKEKSGEFWEYNQLAQNMGKYKGAEFVLRYYDYYRRWSSLVWFAGAIAFWILGKLNLSLVCLATFHLHILFNQLWWKLINLVNMAGGELQDGKQKTSVQAPEKGRQMDNDSSRTGSGLRLVGSD